MKFSDKFVRSQLEVSKHFADGAQLEFARNMQNRLGRLLKFVNRHDVMTKECELGAVRGAIIVPRDELRTGIILYLHGGGYTCGGLDYAKGFATVLSAECGMRVATVEYRLAPEHPFPAAIDDCLEAYKHLLASGYPCQNIILAGESAGGGLCYSLCLKLKELGLPLPAGVVAISPWCDLTLSGESYETNKDTDPTLTKERLNYFVKCYLGEIKSTRTAYKKEKHVDYDTGAPLRTNPFVSPAHADLSDMPPSLIFAGGDEILLSDAEMMHARLMEKGSQAKLVVKEGMWHAYHMYSLKSCESDFKLINKFVKTVMPKDSERTLRWMSLDNSAKIYPAAATTRWTNIFRLSATLTEPVDREVLQIALDVTVRRFPSIAVRLRRGTFWYFLEEIAHAPHLSDEKPYPLAPMPFREIRSCAFRVLVYKNRIAVEFFHALTDGNGGLIFLKSLLAEYISEKYGADIPCTYGILDRLEEPKDFELEDSFLKHCGHFPLSRSERTSYRIWGAREELAFRHITTFIMDSELIHKKAKEMGVTVTALLAGAVIKAGIRLQNVDVPYERKQRPVKVLIPCDLRRLYGSKTLRNFALYATPGIDPRLGEYSFEQICKSVYHQMCLEINPNYMAAKMKTNVKDEENPLLRIVPLFIKNAVMKMIFTAVGEKKSMLSLSNLGVVELPSEMRRYIERLDFVLSVQSKAPYNIGTLSYRGTTYMSVIRNIIEPRLESMLYKVLREEGIAVKVESNQKQ